MWLKIILKKTIQLIIESNIYLKFYILIKVIISEFIKNKIKLLIKN